MKYDDFPHKHWKNPVVKINRKERKDILRVEYGTMPSGQDLVMVKFSNKGRLNLYAETIKSSYPSYSVWTKWSQGINVSTCPRWRRRCGKCTFVIWKWNPPKEVLVSVGFCTFNKNQQLPVPFNARIYIYNPTIKAKKKSKVKNSKVK